MLSAKNRWRISGLIVAALALNAVFTYLVVHHSGLFSLGNGWGWFLTFVVWSWFSLFATLLFGPLIKGVMVRWVEADFENMIKQEAL